MTAQQIAVGEVPALAARVTYVGELGWEFYCPMEYGQRLWDVLWEAGQPEGIVAAGYRAIDSLRLEKGYRYWSADISPDYSPFEAGMGFAVKLDKGNFIGRDALVKQKAEGIQRKLCCLALADPASIALGNEPVRRDDKIVGWITSGGYGYSIRKNLAYAYLPTEHATLGTKLDVELFGERIAATVAARSAVGPERRTDQGIRYPSPRRVQAIYSRAKLEWFAAWGFPDERVILLGIGMVFPYIKLNTSKRSNL